MTSLNQDSLPYTLVHSTIIILLVSKGDIENGCKLIRNRSDCKDIDWTTYTCVLGFQVFGKKIAANVKNVCVSFLYIMFTR